MRILFMHHLPLDQARAGELTRRWAETLQEAGHQVRILIVDRRQQRDDAALKIERVVCRAHDTSAELPFNVPDFDASGGDPPLLAFSALTDEQLGRYRDQLRRHLDAQIDHFDPHLIHVQHVWMAGQLALETGVPYVLSAWWPELIEYERDTRYRALADQAAENAGRILVPDVAVQRRIARVFPSAADRTQLMPSNLQSPDKDSAPAEAARQLVAIYQQVLDERFGA